MRRFSLPAFFATWVFAIPAYAQFSPGSVLEDTTYWNTTAGSDALGDEVSNESSTGVCTSFSGVTYPCGSDNTAAGQQAALSNETGSYNTAFGTLALSVNSSGNFNTAVGGQALAADTASANTATGYRALYSSTTGNYNTASGYESMLDNTSGAQNSAYGLYALRGNGKGSYNTGLGGYALFGNTAGSYNIAAGYKAGFNVTTGSNNIHIGSLGAAGDTDVIKIGTQGTQAATFIAGIAGVMPPGTLAAVYVNSNGQLGVGPPPAESIKADISPMLLNELKQQAAEIRELRAEVQALQASQHN